MNGRALGAAAALAALALDQASKAFIVYGIGMEGREPVVLAPFLSVTLRWNPGISFSLFEQDTSTGRMVLLAFTLAATIFLCVWLWRARGALACLALGAIIGGAIGNAIDRLVYGKVVDFLDFHAFGRNFFVFNLADAAINIGVVLLLAEALFVARRPRPGAQEKAL
jgi:signal peptidase II